MYKTGDYVVKSYKGVCKIENIVTMDMSGSKQDREYYLLVPIDETSSKIYVPTDSPSSILRQILTEEEAFSLIKSIPEIEEIKIINEREREQTYKSVIETCEPAALLAIIKHMYLRTQKRTKEGKKMTSMDDRYFKIAEHVLYSELSVALNKERSELPALIESYVRE